VQRGSECRHHLHRCGRRICRYGYSESWGDDGRGDGVPRWGEAVEGGFGGSEAHQVVDWRLRCACAGGGGLRGGCPGCGRARSTGRTRGVSAPSKDIILCCVRCGSGFTRRTSRYSSAARGIRRVCVHVSTLAVCGGLEHEVAVLVEV